jgi:two-component system phosphate regulon response regulator PhoB
MLLDVMMPEKSGWDVIKTLKGDPTTAQIPVILLSAKGAEEDIKRGYELGALDYIVKPFEIKDLLNEIKNVVREQANYVL